MASENAPDATGIQPGPTPRRRALTALGLGIGLAGWLSGCAARRPGAHPSAVADRAGPVAPSPVDPRPLPELPPVDLAVVNRVTWGADAAAVRRYAAAGSRSAWLEAELRPSETALPPEVQRRVDASTLRQRPVADWVVEMERRRRDADATEGGEDARRAARQGYQQAMNRLARDAAGEQVLRAVYAPNQLQEQLTWFWLNHFNVHQRKANLRAMVGDYADRLRPLALGRFADLLVASATHPAMLRYLDNQQNAARRINENYARELMELHTLGVEGGYTQRDVQELARVLTGLGSAFGEAGGAGAGVRGRVVDAHGLRFDPGRHDAGAKTVLGVAIPPGGGFDEIVAQLVRLARHPSTARHVSRRLARRFVADRPPAEVVEAMAATFRETDGDIARVLRTMFGTAGFEASLGRRFKDPMQYVVSALRVVNEDRPVGDVDPALGWLARLGESPFDRQTPDGYPLDEAAWTGSGQMATRFDVARAIAAAPAGSPFLDRWSATFDPRTRAALADARPGPERLALMLSSPDFMMR